ncbi:MAG: hypothetical protein Q8N31_09750 [Reyranella sp.]|nr:hypothetical protein [Reyranella sp.]MDP3160289.1 hypothetical protein [Reyranella sp.]
MTIGVLCAATLLGGCGWFDGSGGIPPHMKEARPGADRAAPVLKALPPPEGNRPHEAGVSPADQVGRGTVAIGSTVPDKGGQKAQREEAEKQASDLSRKARERRAERDAANEKASAPARVSPEAPPAESSPAESSPATPPPAPQQD